MTQSFEISRKTITRKEGVQDLSSAAGMPQEIRDAFTKRLSSNSSNRINYSNNDNQLSIRSSISSMFSTTSSLDPNQSRLLKATYNVSNPNDKVDNNEYISPNRGKIDLSQDSRPSSSKKQISTPTHSKDLVAKVDKLGYTQPFIQAGPHNSKLNNDNASTKSTNSSFDKALSNIKYSIKGMLTPTQWAADNQLKNSKNTKKPSGVSKFFTGIKQKFTNTSSSTNYPTKKVIYSLPDDAIPKISEQERLNDLQLKS